MGTEAATPPDQVTVILPYPAQLIGLEAAPVLGNFTHRGMSVPLLCLSTVLGLPDPVDPHDARVLLIETAARELAGFVVPSLHAIEDSVWEEPAPKEAGDPAKVLQRGPLVKIGADEHGRLLPNIDLVALVGAELG